MTKKINMEAIDRVLEAVNGITVWILRLYAVLFLVAIISIVVEIVARFYGTATTFSVEFSGYVMASVIAWAGSYALLKKSHIRIDFLYLKRSDSAKNILDLMSIALFFLVAAFIAWSTGRLVLESVEYGLVSNTTLRIPLWIPQASWAAGFLWLALCAGLLLIKAIVSWKNGDRKGMADAVGASEESPL